MEIDWSTADPKNASMLITAAVTFARGAFNFGSFDPGMKELKAALKFLENLPPSPLRTRLVKKVKDMAIYGKRMMDLSAQNRPDRERSDGLGDLGMATKKKKKKPRLSDSELRVATAQEQANEGYDLTEILEALATPEEEQAVIAYIRASDFLSDRYFP
jgi:hypothetical protein